MEKMLMHIASFFWVLAQFFNRMYELFNLFHTAKMNDKTLVEYHDDEVRRYRSRYWKAREHLTPEQSLEIHRNN